MSGDIGRVFGEAPDLWTDTPTLTGALAADGPGPRGCCLPGADRFPHRSGDGRGAPRPCPGRTPVARRPNPRADGDPPYVRIPLTAGSDSPAQRRLRCHRDAIRPVTGRTCSCWRLLSGIVVGAGGMGRRRTLVPVGSSSRPRGRCRSCRHEWAPRTRRAVVAGQGAAGQASRVARQVPAARNTAT
jgi:hypothetical protein